MRGDYVILDFIVCTTLIFGYIVICAEYKMYLVNKKTSQDFEESLKGGE